jgi:hypothetical protein
VEQAEAMASRITSIDLISSPARVWLKDYSESAMLSTLFFSMLGGLALGLAVSRHGTGGIE